MDFFEAQAAAHRSTTRLIGMFAAAVLSMITLTVLIVAAVIAWGMPPAGLLTWQKMLQALSPTLVLGVAGAVLAIVLLASVFRLLGLSRGGRTVAETLDGRLLQPNTTDPKERQLLNVVEEMAIAAGLPVPPVYVIEEDGINAFAAGYGMDDAVVGITKGALERLDRSELQGVIGHEFSHVLNGDMRLNIRLMSVLFGILVLGLVGRALIGTRHGAGRSSRNRNTAQLAMLGVGLLIIGYVGTFFGNMIKAAVSRQREFLADASAVQFTRDPSGIAGVLKKIGGSTAGARIGDPRADEMSHMFFGQTAAPMFGLGGLLATHPPIEARIRAVEPGWDGNFLFATAGPAPGEAAMAAGTDADAGVRTGVERGDNSGLDALHDALHVVDLPDGEKGAAVASGAVQAGVLAAGLTAGQGAGPGAGSDRALGTITPGDVDRAHQLIDGIPAALHSAAHDPFGARAVIYALLIADDAELRATQLAHLHDHAEAGVPGLLSDLLAAVPALARASMLTLVHLAAPALKTLSDRQYARFRDNLTTLIRADAHLSRFEWILHQVLMKELRPHFEGIRRRRGAGASVEAEADACATLLMLLAQTGHGDAEGIRAAFRAGMASLGLDAERIPEPIDDRNQRRLNEAMRRLRDLAPLAQPRLLKACVAAVEHDNMIQSEERDLLQGIAAALDCPLPPLGRTLGD